MPNNWREQFDKDLGWLVDDKQGGWTAGKKELEAFIQSKFAELIDEIPEAYEELDDGSFQRQNVKQQLRDKWIR